MLLTDRDAVFALKIPGPVDHALDFGLGGFSKASRNILRIILSL